MAKESFQINIQENNSFNLNIKTNDTKIKITDNRFDIIISLLDFIKYLRGQQ